MTPLESEFTEAIRRRHPSFESIEVDINVVRGRISFTASERPQSGTPEKRVKGSILLEDACFGYWDAMKVEYNE